MLHASLAFVCRIIVLWFSLVCYKVLIILCAHILLHRIDVNLCVSPNKQTNIVNRRSVLFSYLFDIHSVCMCLCIPVCYLFIYIPNMLQPKEQIFFLMSILFHLSLSFLSLSTSRSLPLFVAFPTPSPHIVYLACIQQPVSLLMVFHPEVDVGMYHLDHLSLHCLSAHCRFASDLSPINGPITAVWPEGLSDDWGEKKRGELTRGGLSSSCTVRLTRSLRKCHSATQMWQKVGALKRWCTFTGIYI